MFYFGFLFAGLCAGSITGILGAGGGMLLVPILSFLKLCKQEELFPTSLSIMIPICAVSLIVSWQPVPVADVFPYLLGSALGGIAAGKWGQKIPSLYLHRVFGILILWGGIRYLW